MGRTSVLLSPSPSSVSGSIRKSKFPNGQLEAADIARHEDERLRAHGASPLRHGAFVDFSDSSRPSVVEEVEEGDQATTVTVLPFPLVRLAPAGAVRAGPGMRPFAYGVCRSALG